MELRWNASYTTVLASLVVALGVWATVFDGWRNDILRTLLLEPGADKLAHVLVYGAAALAFGLLSERVLPRVAWLVGPSLAWAIGVADELRQAGVRGRTASVEDLIANTIGVVFVAIVLYTRRRSPEVDPLNTNR